MIHKNKLNSELLQKIENYISLDKKRLKKIINDLKTDDILPVFRD